MIPRLSPKKMIIIGGICLLLGFILPLLVVIKTIPSNFPLLFVIYALQLFGMVISLLGIFTLGAQKRKERLEREEYGPDWKPKKKSK